MTRAEKIAYGILVSFALIFVAVCVTMGVEKHAQERQLKEAYARAEALVQGGEYAGALDVLEEMEDSYRNVKSLRYYSHAHLSYDLGNVADADSDLILCDLYMASGEVMPEEYDDFCAKVSAEYAAYVEARAQKEREAYREKIRTGVPFVGMSESDIANTSLGAPSSKVRHNWDWVRGERATANLYDFYENGRRIFSARCLSGWVTQVWDWRDMPPAPKLYSSAKTSTRQEDEGDPLNAKDYLFPEDFYEDHFDDFFDFYDAEDYYYEHGGS